MLNRSSISSHRESLDTHNRASDANANGNSCLILHCHPYRCDMFSSVSNDGEKDQPNEGFGDVVSACSFIDRSNHYRLGVVNKGVSRDGLDLTVIGAERGNNCHNEQPEFRCQFNVAERMIS